MMIISSSNSKISRDLSCLRWDQPVETPEETQPRRRCQPTCRAQNDLWAGVWRRPYDCSQQLLHKLRRLLPPQKHRSNEASKMHRRNRLQFDFREIVEAELHSQIKNIGNPSACPDGLSAHVIESISAGIIPVFCQIVNRIIDHRDLKP